MTSAAAFLLVGFVMMVCGAWMLWGPGAAMLVAGVLSVAVGVDLARSPRTPATGTGFPTADEAQK